MKTSKEDRKLAKEQCAVRNHPEWESWFVSDLLDDIDELQNIVELMAQYIVGDVIFEKDRRRIRDMAEKFRS